jgi:hypothetical protein
MKDYKKYFVIPAPPEMVYRALTNEATLKLWTGEDAKMEETEGFEFSLWEESITGINIAFEKNHKIVQQWYFGDQKPDSIVTIKLHPHKAGTSAELIHSNIPDDYYDNIVMGWEDIYFGALTAFYQ